MHRAWAFVHFLAFGEKGAHAASLDAYVRGVLNGADPVASLASAIGDVARLETPFAAYLDRGIYGYLRVDIAARLTREGFKTRELPAGQSAALRASFHAAMQRANEARALIAEADKAGPEGVAEEARALLAEMEGQIDGLVPLLERAVTRPTTSGYAPFRLATMLPTTGAAALARVEALLLQATGRNASADAAWAFLGEVQAALDRGDVALAAIQRAVQLRPASSAYRVSLARVLRKMNRLPDAIQAAGSARALARTTGERDDAQEMLAELAKAANAPAPEAAERTDAAPATTPAQPNASPPRVDAPAPEAPNEPGATPATREPDCGGMSLQACRQSAEALLDRNGPGDADRARALLRSACEAGDAASCALLERVSPR